MKWSRELMPGRMPRGWFRIGLLAAASAVFPLGAGCHSGNSGESKPGALLASDGKTAPPEAQAAMQAGNGPQRTGPKTKGHGGGPPD